MPELRKDPIVGRWVIVATERARRPGNIVSSEDNTWEGEHPSFDDQISQLKEVYTASDNGSGWKVKVVSSPDPVLQPDSPSNRQGHGLYDVMNGVGVHEIVIETPDNITNMADLEPSRIEMVIQSYVARLREFEKDPQYRYVSIYKNYGRAAGSRPISHAQSQIIVTPIIPSRVKEKLVGAKRYFDYHERCVYQDLIRQEQSQKVRVLLETDHFIVMAPFAARFLFETWIIPKQHHCDFHKGIIGLEGELAGVLKQLLLKLKIGLDDPAYNFVIQTAPFRHPGDKKGQWKTIEEDYRWHIEVMPRLTQMAGFEKGTGFYICSAPPEYTMEYLREVEI